jgi:hypothetical protein
LIVNDVLSLSLSHGVFAGAKGNGVDSANAYNPFQARAK